MYILQCCALVSPLDTCHLTLDPNTAHKKLSLSEANRKVMRGKEKHAYPNHLKRFDTWPQVLCREAMTGRCYWEVGWSGGVDVGVTYRGLGRKGAGGECGLGINSNSWCLFCSGNSYAAKHNGNEAAIMVPSLPSRRVGVYLDWPGGVLSFYSVSSDALTHLYTFHCTFSEPLYPGFRVWSASAMYLC